MSLHDRIENDFVYHPPTALQPEKYELIRDTARKVAHLIDDLVPDGREKSTAISKLEEMVFWANAGIARG